MEYLVDIGKKAKEASKQLGKLSTREKNDLLRSVAQAIKERKEYILEQNKIDVTNAQQNGLKASYVDRLMLNERRMTDIYEAFLQIAQLDDPIGDVLSMKTMENGLVIGQKRVPMGVICIIYESRPNVTADAFALCLKVSSCTILRGGKEAIRTNKALVDLFRQVLEANHFDPNMVQLIEHTEREVTVELMKLNQYIDVLIPRGSNSLIQTVIQNSTIPVIETGIGNCTIFVDESADFEMAKNIILNAKTQRTGVCNSCENILVHERIADTFVPLIGDALSVVSVEIRGCENARKLRSKIVPATVEDYQTEFLDLIVSLKIVRDIDEAMTFIDTYGTKHSEAIITENYSNAQRFLAEVDAAAVYVNASTRFTDGFEFGFGAEIGISTQKLHARGPMGLKELTTTKYIIYGNGQTRP